jgi:hypothetical protein
MRVAVILTGALRTIRKTIRYVKQNLLDVNKNVDVFLCVQNDNYHLESDWVLWYKENMGDCMKSIVWFSLDKFPQWVGQRDILLQHMNIEASWKEYLRRSGSMIEYAQLQMAYIKMTEYEQKQKFKYDYVVRTRTDSIFCKPIDFHWLQWSDEEVEQRVRTLHTSLQEAKRDTTKLLSYFMNTIVSDDLLGNIPCIHSVCYPSEADALRPSSVDGALDSAALNQYIKRGRYVLTFRKNNLYIVRRDLFYMIPSLGTMYGQFTSPYSDAWWFNAEGQFTSACYHAGLTTYDYNTAHEDRSVEVNGWNASLFFDENMNCLNPMMMYCVVRR